MKIIDPRHVHAIVLCKEPHTVPNVAYCTQIRTLCQLVNYLQGKIQRNSLQGNTEVTAVHSAKTDQLLGWKKRALWSACGAVLVPIWLCQQQMLTGRARHISEISSSDHFPAHTADSTLGMSSRCGWAGTGHTSDAGLPLHWGCRLGFLPPLPIPASIQLSPKVTESDRADGMTGRWHSHSLPTADDGHTSGGSMFLV